MEGLAVAPDPRPPRPVTTERLAERWLAFLFLLLLGVVAIVAVCVELLAAHPG